MKNLLNWPTWPTWPTTKHIHSYRRVYTPYPFAYKTKCEISGPSGPGTVQTQSYQGLQHGPLRKKQWANGPLEWPNHDRRLTC